MSRIAPQGHRLDITAMHSVILTIGLFALTFLSPGPNLLVVVQSSLSHGRSAGIAAGLGVALGDGIYAAVGLLGMAAVIGQSGELFAAVKVVGGTYLLWMAWNLLRKPSSARFDAAAADGAQPSFKPFLQGLMTDLANPQTMLFFASIFAVTLTADTPAWAKTLSWLGIVSASVVWRVLLSVSFSHSRVRAAYLRAQRTIECLTGVALAGFGAKLLFDGIPRT
jgi:amino acid exporter